MTEEMHPARERLVDFVVESVVGSFLFFLFVSVATGTMLAGAMEVGLRETGYVVVSSMTIAVILTQMGYWNGDDSDENEVDFSEIHWLGKTGLVLVLLLYLNALTFVAVIIGMTAGATWGLTAVVSYLLYDMLSVEWGIPFSITGIVSVLLGIGFLVGHLIDSLIWKELSPNDFMFRFLGRRVNPR